MSSQINLVEIDLLRDGQHTTAVPRNLAIKKAGSFDYHVCVHRYDKFEDFLVYPIMLDQKLPEIEIPLMPGDQPVAIDFQLVFDRAYDSGPYHRRVRYQETAPIPPLEPNRSGWVKKLLSGKD